uniref:Uncharacterized protein n=1 Tax=Rhizophora mucronata TaxID=61149 RepID=A0A2P2QFK1_RHIMU
MLEQCFENVFMSSKLLNWETIMMPDLSFHYHTEHNLLKWVELDRTASKSRGPVNCKERPEL